MSRRGDGGQVVLVGQVWFLVYDGQVVRMCVTKISGDLVVLVEVGGEEKKRVISTSTASLIHSAALDDRKRSEAEPAAVLTWAETSSSWEDTTVSERPRGVDET